MTDALHGMRSRRPVLSGTAETGATIQVFRGDACTGPATTTTSAAQGTWSIATDPTTDTPADGPTIYTARATDALGNTGCSAAFTCFSDNTPPETTITFPAVPTFTNDEQWTFTFTSNEPAAHFECASGTAAFAPCTLPVFPTSGNLGSLELRVRAIDFGGNVDPSPASFTWTTTESPMLQYKTITHALAVASAGQVILVRPGTYDVAHGEVFPLVIGDRTAVIGDEAQRGGADPHRRLRRRPGRPGRRRHRPPRRPRSSISAST